MKFKGINFNCRYFTTLQKQLEPYDCVLYEMVASKESLENRRNRASITKLKASRSRGFNILGCIQRQMARILMLDFQLDCLDYQGDNWYHADLDYETFKSLQVISLALFFSLLKIPNYVIFVEFLNCLCSSTFGISLVHSFVLDLL